MTIAVDWDVKNQTKLTKLALEHEKIYWNGLVVSTAIDWFYVILWV